MHKQELENRYVQGYKKVPERTEDLESLFLAGLGSFTLEEW